MPGFMADFDADMARPQGVLAAGGGPGSLISVASVGAGAYAAATSLVTVPPGATSCLVQCVGGGGNTYVSNGSYQGYTGGGAFAESRITVAPGQTFSVTVGGNGSSNAASQPGIPTTVSYAGTLVCYGDNGLGTGGAGGQASNCVGNLRRISGTPQCSTGQDQWGNAVVIGRGAYSVPYGWGAGANNQLGPPGGAAFFYFFAQ